MLHVRHARSNNSVRSLQNNNEKITIIAVLTTTFGNNSQPLISEFTSTALLPVKSLRCN